eukprot:GGOE01015106.1.p1 GENE.GGOE01015106.1~~GGOE01015106.1.p1  ORF type:complete len:1127 (+),score=369.04 GGOE01015106.1:221-3382(+)
MLEILSGLMLGMLVFAFCNVYASAVFMQHFSLYSHLQSAVSINVLAAALLCAVSVRYSKLGVYIGSPDINPTIIHVALVNHLVESIPADQVQAQLLPTLVAAIALSTAFVSVTTYVLGTYHWTRLVQFTPTTVVRGFLACVGMEIIRTAIENATGLDFQPSLAHNWALVTNPEFWMWLLPALAVGVPLYLFKRFDIMSSGVLFPVFLTLPVFIFYTIVVLTNASLDDARRDGWLYPATKSGDCLDYWRGFDYTNINVRALLHSGWYMVIMIIIVSVDFLLKLVGTEDVIKMDIDFDHEFRVTGIANSVLSLLLLPPGYGSLKFMLLNYSVVGCPDVRLPTAIAAAFNFVLFAVGFPLINFLPRFFLAGLFIYAALAFMVENLIDSYRLLTKKEYCVVWLLVLLHFFLPLYIEVGVGLLLASGIFVVQYATRSPIKVMMSGADYRAVTRTLLETQKLGHLGAKMLTIVRLQGYIFFGSATQVLEALASTTQAGRTSALHNYIVLDFDEVTGVDSSSNAVFLKLARQTRKGNCTILWSGLNPRRYMRFKQAQVISNAVTFPDVDSAVEWCEDQMLLFSQEQREKWLVSDMLWYIHAVHHVQYMVSASCHGLLSPSLLRRFQHYCEARTFTRGMLMMEPGTVVNEFYFIRDGRVEVWLPTGDEGRMKRIGIRTGGTFLYTDAFWMNRRAEAMVKVTETTHVWMLNRDSMERMQREAPDVAIQLRDAVLRHVIITDMRLRRRLLAFGGNQQSQSVSNGSRSRSRFTSWSPRVTRAVVSMAVMDDLEAPVRRWSLQAMSCRDGLLPPLREEEVLQYTDFYHHEVASAPFQESFAGSRSEGHGKLLQAIHIVTRMQEGLLSDTAQTRTEHFTKISDLSQEHISLEQFLKCMHHALLAPLAHTTVQKLREMFEEGAQGKETIDVAYLFDMCRPVGHDVSNEQLRELLTELDEDLCCAMTFDKVVHLFSRLQRRQLFAEQIEDAFRRFSHLDVSSEDHNIEFGSPTALSAPAITADILRDSLPQFGVQYDELTIQRMILEADANNDGWVDFDEFVATVCSL